jgi:hypothetical protein
MVAIGWEELDVDPSKVDDSQLRAALKKILDPEKPGSVDFGVRTIRDFMNFAEWLDCCRVPWAGS